MKRRYVMVALLAMAALATPTIARSHNGTFHYMNAVNSTRAYQNVVGGNYTAWMSLSTSQGLYTCDGDTAVCTAKWQPGITQALSAWNITPTTVFFQHMPDNSFFYDVNIRVEDVIPGHETSIGTVLLYDQSYTLCNPAPSSELECPGGRWYYAWVILGDDESTGPFGTTAAKKAAVGHELGHVLALKHESVGNVCGMDTWRDPIYDAFTVPQSIMSYHCIAPTAIGGIGLTDPTAWDVCGVNHTYPDPSYTHGRCNEDFGLFRDHKLDANGDGYSDADESFIANCGVASCGSLLHYGAKETRTCKDTGRKCGGTSPPPSNESVPARIAPPPATGYGCSVTLDTVGPLKTTHLAKSDLDLDGSVSILDLAQVAGWFLQPIHGSAGDPRWEGNMDGDRVISIIDLTIMASNFARQVAPTCRIL